MKSWMLASLLLFGLARPGCEIVTSIAYKNQIEPHEVIDLKTELKLKSKTNDKDSSPNLSLPADKSAGLTQIKR